MPKILLVDDDEELCSMLGAYLGAEGYLIDLAHDGESALGKATAENFDVIVLDIMMPGMDGLQVLRTLRDRKATPVLMLTARGEDVESVIGLEMGADDYLAKPCNPRVLSARIRAVLRRAESRRERNVAHTLTFDNLVLQTGSRTVSRDGELVQLTGTEFSILETLARDAGHIVPRAELSERALGRTLGRFDRSLDMHLSKLRQKLGPRPNGEERIKTVRGAGYLFVV